MTCVCVCVAILLNARGGKESLLDPMLFDEKTL